MPTSAYPLAFPKALASWAISPVWACGWLPAPHLHLRCKCRCLWRAPNGLLCSAYPFRVTLGRCFMPGLFASEHLSTMCPIGLETVPFWVQPAPHLRGLSSGFGWFRITTPQRTFSYLVHRPVRLLWLSSRFRPAFTSHTPREGAVSRSPGRQGLIGYRFTVSLTCMDMQLRRSNDPRRSSPTHKSGFERTGRTHSVLRTRLRFLV